MAAKKILFVFGTRPEAIKMAPIIKAARNVEHLEVFICTTGQHAEMLQQVMDFFELKADIALQLMQPNQTLFDITAIGLTKLQQVLEEVRPDWVLVQGDTTTAFIGALAAYYKQIKVGHIEAGLRSFDKYAPFPEEVNRKMVSVVADHHFAPTAQAKNNLEREGVTKNVFITGNSVIDAFLWGVQKVRANDGMKENFDFLQEGKRIILVTAHRRESFGQPFENICAAIRRLATEFPDVQVIYPVHLNPNVQEVVQRTLSGISNVSLIAPLNYAHLIWLMDKAYIIITDSGGIQEEAPALGKPVLVVRNVTERQEGIDAGTAMLVGTDSEKIYNAASLLLNDSEAYSKMQHAVNPYGNGTSAAQIINLLSAS